VHLEVSFSDRALAGLVLQELSKIPDIVLNVLRGRITVERAWFRLEVAGLARKVRDVIRRCRQRADLVRTVSEKFSYV
jgi:hypothetical protein